MTRPFDLHDASYDVLLGASALGDMARELAGHGDGEPLHGADRDRMVFSLRAMAEKASACAECWIDDLETRNGSKEVSA
jgi:hypothetical protein